MQFDKYTIVRSSSYMDIVSKVNDHLGRGWVCQGGIVVLPKANLTLTDYKYNQAMVRPVKVQVKL
jgi:hypothetical protein